MATIPAPSDPKLLDTLVALREEAVRARKAVETKYRWKECEQSFDNRNYAGMPHAEWQSTGDAPKTWEAIKRTVPILTDAKPKLMLTGRGPEDALAVEHLQLGVDQEMEKQQVMLLFPRVLEAALKIGTAFMLTRLEVKGTRVKFVTEFTSAWNVYADPLATNDLDMTYTFIKRRMRLSRLLELFPHRAEAIQNAAGAGSWTGDPRVRLSTLTDSGLSPNPGWGETTTADGETEVVEITRTGKHLPGVSQFVDVWEGYFVDGDTLDVEVELADGSHEVVPQDRHPTGRIVTMVGDLILEDIDSPFAHGQIPVTRVICYDTGGYYGQSFIDALLDPHKTISMIDNKIVDWLVLAGDPERVVDDDSGVEVEHDFTAPGKVVAVKPGSRYEWRDAPQMPQYIWNLRDAKSREFDDAVGINEVSKGNLNTFEDVSGKAIDAANEQNNQRIRLIQRNFEAAVSRWGQQTVANLIQFRPYDDWLRVLPPGTVELGWETWTDDDLRDWPNVVMSAGSSLPVNKAARRNEYIMYHREGILGEPGSPGAVAIILEALDIPNRDKIMANVMESWNRRMMMEQQASMQQQMAAQPRSPGGGATDKALGGEPDAQEAMDEQGRLEGVGAGAEQAGFVG